MRDVSLKNDCDTHRDWHTSMAARPTRARAVGYHESDQWEFWGDVQLYYYIASNTTY
jgi:hypothetical protein